MSKSKFFDRLIERLDGLDDNGIQAYVLRLSKEKGFLDTIFNTIHEGILVIDRRLAIRYVNKAGREFLGIPEDPEKLRISRFIRDVDWKRIMQRDEDEWYRVSRQEIEVFYPTRRILLFYLVPVEGGRGEATVILSDVTQHREDAEAALETEKLHMVSLLAAGVAHEIGNPLNSLYLHLQLLQRQLDDDELDVVDARELVRTSRKEVERLDSIINQFLKAVRPSKPNLVPIDLKSVIIETLTFMRGEIENRSVDVKCHWPDLLPKISGDEALLKQAFYNIIKNSLQAMPEGGSIHIRCEFDDDFVGLSMNDTGKGIDHEAMGRIFDPYFTSKPQGNGLGLMVVERIIRDHGGELTVESEPGEGARFHFNFPRQGRRMRLLPCPDHVDEILVDKPNEKQPNESDQQ